MKLFIFLFLLPFCLAELANENDVGEYALNYENRTMIPVETLINKPPTFPSPRSSNEKWGSFQSKINHFGINPGWFTIRYLYNLQFATINSPPIIVYLGGEWEISPNSLSSGIVYEIAQENKGAMFYLEHRFYGQSHPRPDLSTQNLIYHSSRQAVEDIIAFYNYLRQADAYRNSKLILVGCSYSASLATFTKQIYPNIVTGVYASSGPLFATMDMYEYMEIVSQVISNVNRECATTISEAIAYIEEYYDQYSTWMREKFRICNVPLTSLALDRAALIQRFVYRFANMVQSSVDSLSAECNRLISSPGGTAFDRFVNYFAPGASNCAPGSFYSIPGTYMSTATSNTGRAWFWQQCQEFGWSVTTYGGNQLFGKSIRPSLYHEICRSVFGIGGQSDKEISDKMDASNKRYNVYPGQGARLRNVVLMYGSIDPWMPMGHNMLPQSNTTMFLIPGSGHCHDLAGNSNTNMINARAQAKTLIRSWLQ